MNKFSKDYQKELDSAKPSKEFRSRLVATLEKEQKKQKFSLVKSTGFKVAVASITTLAVGGGIFMATRVTGKKGGDCRQPNSIVSNHMQAYGAQITVEDIKKAYSVDDSKDIMPLYNVSQSESFTFDFKFNGYDAGIDLYDYVTVHTDYECKPESAIYYTAKMDVGEDKTTLSVAPMEPVLKTESQASDYAFEGIDSWGNAPMYYLAIHYDMENETPTELKEPVIIPFTVKNEVDAPNAKGVVDETGRFKLVWEPVKGAEKYRIYNLTDGSLNTGVDNHAINGAQVGYKNLTMLFEAETTDCEFNNFAGEHHGLAQIEDDMVKYEVGGNKDVDENGVCVFTVGQNYCVNGEFFVTAVVNGVEGGISAPITTAELVLPYEVEDEHDISFKSYASAEDFPSEIEVRNIDGSVSKHTISYERAEGVTYLGFYRVQYNYRINGTAMTGYVYPEDQNTYPRFVGVPSKDGGLVTPDDNVNKTPDSSVETIITPDEVATEGNAVADSSNLIDTQIKNTKNHIKLGNKKSVENVPEGVYVIADSAEEEWLALNLIQANEVISTEGFVKLQDPYVLVDMLEKVCAQNPYVLGVAAYSYDYKNFSLKVEYNYSHEEIAKMQSEIAKKALKVLEDITTEKMTNEEKVVAFYDYLRKNVSYDETVLAEVVGNDFSKGSLKSYENAFNAYGAFVDNKGVCTAYSYAFKMLCDYSDIECTVVTGCVKGNVAHAWNEIVIDGVSYEIDCASEIQPGDKPYAKSFNDTESTKNLNYVRDNYYKLDK